MRPMEWNGLRCLNNCWDCSVEKQVFKQIFWGFLSTKKNDSFIITATNKLEISKIILSLNI